MVKDPANPKGPMIPVKAELEASKFANDPDIVGAIQKQANEYIKEIKKTPAADLAKTSKQPKPHGAFGPVVKLGQEMKNHWFKTLWVGSAIGEILYPKFVTYDNMMADINNQLATGKTPDNAGASSDPKVLEAWAKEAIRVADDQFELQIYTVIATEAATAGGFGSLKILKWLNTKLAKFQIPGFNALDNAIAYGGATVAQFIVHQINVRGDVDNEQGLVGLTMASMWDEKGNYRGMPFSTIAGLAPGIVGQGLSDFAINSFGPLLDSALKLAKEKFPKINFEKTKTPVDTIKDRMKKEDEIAQWKKDHPGQPFPGTATPATATAPAQTDPQADTGSTTQPQAAPADTNTAKVGWEKSSIKPEKDGTEVWTWGGTTANAPKVAPPGTKFGYDNMFLYVPSGQDPNK
jgi:hypothetical protein